jgi:uncharacterized protein YcgI (DUF1989 family)
VFPAHTQIPLYRNEISSPLLNLLVYKRMHSPFDKHFFFAAACDDKVYEIKSVEKEGKKFHMCTSSFFTTIAAVLR